MIIVKQNKKKVKQNLKYFFEYVFLMVRKKSIFVFFK